MDDLFRIVEPNLEAINASTSTDYVWTEADELRERIRQTACYLTLQMALAKNGISNPLGKANLMRVSEIGRHAPDSEILDCGAALLSGLIETANRLEKTLRPLKSRSAIVQDFNGLCRNGVFDWSTGLPYGWLVERFDCKHMNVPEGFPKHGTIGVGHHAGFFVAQEKLLLVDAFVLRQRVKEHCVPLEAVARGERRLRDEEAEVARQHAASLCRDARTCVSLLHSFIECLVNSVAENHIQTCSGLAEADIQFLRGKKGKKWIPLRRRIEGAPGIVNGSRQTTYVATDNAQSPFDIRRFFELVTPIRDSVAHNSIFKESIWRGPRDWERITQEAGTVTLSMSRRFWKACYPKGPRPEYLWDFDLNKIETVAGSSVKQELQGGQ